MPKTARKLLPRWLRRKDAAWPARRKYGLSFCEFVHHLLLLYFSSVFSFAVSCIPVEIVARWVPELRARSLKRERTLLSGMVATAGVWLLSFVGAVVGDRITGGATVERG
jgi:hypothetical protein